MSQKRDWREQLAEKLSGRGEQKRFAEKVGCSESHLSLVLKRSRRLSYDLAKRIEAEADIPVDELMAPPLAPSEAAE